MSDPVFLRTPNYARCPFAQPMRSIHPRDFRPARPGARLARLTAGGAMYFRYSLAALVFGVASGTAMAQGFPSKPITIVHGLGAGSGTDISARRLAEEVSKDAGVAVIVEPRAG